MADTSFFLIADPDDAFAAPLREKLLAAGHACVQVASADEALESIRTRPPDVLICEHDLAGTANGIELLQAARRLHPDGELIMITASAEPGLARLVLRGELIRAYDFLSKPVLIDEAFEAAEAAALAARSRSQTLRLRDQLDKDGKFGGIVTRAASMARLIHQARAVADSKLTVLIQGESGTGKELLAHAVHAYSPRRNRVYHARNCAGLPEGTLESELFGHVRGAFSGADRERVGLFEHCDGGTLFLDEIGDMPLSMQAKLLRVLAVGEVIPVGSNEIRRVDVRVVAATHRNLTELIEQGKFREDLYYRLNRARLRVPPLRERREDIPLLIDHFLTQANREHGKKVTGLAPEVLHRLMSADWRGNIRELENVLHAAVVIAAEGTLRLEHLPEDLRGGTDIVPAGPRQSFAGIPLHVLERKAIIDTLASVGGNREQAARLLEIGPRTIYRKIKEYDLEE